MQIEQFPGSSPERLVHAALCPDPTPDDGENTATLQIRDAIVFAGQHDQVAICLDENDKLLGAVSFTPSAGDATLVRYLGSHRKGVGTALLAQVARDAAGRDEGIILESVPSASGFYDQLGFERYGTSELGYPLYALDLSGTAKLAAR